MLRIRAADAGDHDQVQQLWDEAGLGRAAPDEWTALIEAPTAVVLVAEADGEFSGAAVASYDGWRAYIYHVAVAPRFRKQGLGDALLTQAEEYLTEAGARHVYVMVNEQSTEGLALVGARGYLPEGDIVLAKRLAVRVA